MERICGTFLRTLDRIIASAKPAIRIVRVENGRAEIGHASQHLSRVGRRYHALIMLRERTR